MNIIKAYTNEKVVVVVTAVGKDNLICVRTAEKGKEIVLGRKKKKKKSSLPPSFPPSSTISSLLPTCPYWFQNSGMMKEQAESNRQMTHGFRKDTVATNIPFIINMEMKQYFQSPPSWVFPLSCTAHSFGWFVFIKIGIGIKSKTRLVPQTRQPYTREMHNIGTVQGRYEEMVVVWGVD